MISNVDIDTLGQFLQKMQAPPIEKKIGRNIDTLIRKRNVSKLTSFLSL